MANRLTRTLRTQWRARYRNVLLLLAAFLIGCTAPDAPKQSAPNVLLITIDTLRPDALGWVAGKNATPNLDRLAQAGFRFPHAVSPVPLTLPAHTSMMTGMIPLRHGVHDNGQIVSDDAVTLASLLKARGYRTGAVISGFPLRKPFGLDRGFDVYDDVLDGGNEGWLERKAVDTVAQAVAFIDDRDDSQTVEQPWFLWVHFYDPHDPYEPPQAFRKDGPRGAYDGEVAYLDDALKPLIERVSAASTELITVVTADHGESFGEHGEYGHGQFIYDATTLVPLVFHAPGRITPGTSTASARLVDITPTVLDLVHAPPLADVDGVSLRPLLEGRPLVVPPAFVETRQPWIAYGWAPLSSLRQQDWKYIHAPRPELYDLKADPGELKNLHGEQIVIADGLAIDHAAIAARPQAHAATTENAALLAQLQSLGYVGAGRAAGAVPADAADPKDRLQEYVYLSQGEQLLRANRFDEARDAFAGVLAREPDNRFAVLRSGVAMLKKGDLAAAKPFLARATELDPEQAEARFAYADVLSRSGLIKEAIVQWLETTRLQPRRVAAWSNLGAMFAQDGQLEKAHAALAQAASIDPGNPQLLVNLAFLDRAMGEAPRAIEGLQSAARLSGDAFEYSGTLGILLLPAHGASAAKPWLARARANEVDFAEARFQLALVEAYAGNQTAAREALREAIAAQPMLAAKARDNPLIAGLLR